MPELPLLFFPKSTTASRTKRTARGTPLIKPSPAAQQARHDRKFQKILNSFQNLTSSVEGMEPEQVIVLETLGSSVENLVKAAEQIPGLEWLTEIGLEDADPSDGFVFQGKPNEKLSHRLYALMSNQQSMTDLVRIWTNWCRHPEQRAELNFGAFKNIFIHLKDVRRWGVQDRIVETKVVESWELELKHNKGIVRFEMELWCRGSDRKRKQAYADVEHLVTQSNGRCISSVVIPSILYYGVLAEMPAAKVQDTIEAIKDRSYTTLLRCPEVMFFRPHAQSMFRGHKHPKTHTPAEKNKTTKPFPKGEPVIALLDGLPLEHHTELDKRLVIDDEDDHAAQYKPSQQQHGTAMASLIAHGDLNNAENPLSRPIYVRPILVPTVDFNNNSYEVTPSNALLVDLIHRAIIRIKGVDNTPGQAPQVKVVNLSIGNSFQPFFRHLSPLARLLDWLSWTYKLLFIVSVGNQSSDITLSLNTTDTSKLTDDELIAKTLEALHLDQISRRPFSPAEAINVLTIGALHHDGSTATGKDLRVDLLRGAALPSPICTVASGFNRAMKPDVLFPAGKQLYRPPSLSTVPPSFSVSHSTSAPGILVAAPSPMPLELSHTVHSRGSSNATALATRAAAQIYERLRTLRSEPGGDRLTDEYWPVVLKTLLVHGASWGSAAEKLDRVFKDVVPDAIDRHRLICKFLGYGAVDPTRSLLSTDKRVLMLGWDSISEGDGHEYYIPLPPSLSGRKIKRRLTVTLAWLTPSNPYHKDYRRAFLWFGVDENQLSLKKTDTNDECSKRGTVQHRVFESHVARGFSDGDALKIKVNCEEDAGKLLDPIPYALAATLEITDTINLKIFKEIQDRIRLRVPVTSKSS